MLIVVLAIVVIVAALVLLVLGLHKYQLSVTQSNVDKHSPLPPLDEEDTDRELTGLSLDDEEFNPHSLAKDAVDSINDETTFIETADTDTADFESALFDADDTGIEKAETVSQSAPAASDRHEPEPENDQSGLHRSSTGDEIVDEITDEPADEIEIDKEKKTVEADEVTEVTLPDSAITDGDSDRQTSSSADDDDTEITPPPPSLPESPAEALPAANDSNETADKSGQDSWQDEVAELKKQNLLDEALQICHRAFPLWSAYQQASLIHRARLKQLAQSGQSIDLELDSLYRLAAQASLLHDRVKGLPNLPLSRLKRVDLDEIEQLDMPYKKIGYNELRLIKKTDIKLLLEAWGKPSAHIKPRELHSEAWRHLMATHQSTLF